jgi:hypothetical protein
VHYLQAEVEQWRSKDPDAGMLKEVNEELS